MSEAPELEGALWGEAMRLGIPVRPAVLHTGWNVGPVTAYLFPDDPVTLVDCGYDNPQARAELEDVFASAGHRLRDVKRIIVTHGHTDHYGCARWLQELSGCEVLMHREDADRMGDEWRVTMRELFAPLGVSREILKRFFKHEGSWPPGPERLDALGGGEIFDAGACRLRIEHRPGHSPGHVWAVDERTGAIFAGDFLLANSPTNAGMEADGAGGRMQMLRLYDEGLRAMAAMHAPVVFPAHGPPITDHARLIRRRLEKSDRRTTHVLHRLADVGACMAIDLVMRMYGDRIARAPFEFVADVVGRLDVLVADGRATARKRDDGVWLFEAKEITDA